LQSAPIVEAIVQWDARMETEHSASDLQELIQGRLPDYPICRPQYQFDRDLAMMGGALAPGQVDQWFGYKLTSVDGLHNIQFNRRGLVFSRLKPYQNWGNFIEAATTVWQVYVELAQPAMIQRLSVRFINQIQEVSLTKLDKYLKTPPRGLEKIGLPRTGFLQQITHDVPGWPFQIKVVETVQPAAQGEIAPASLIVDINVATKQPFEPLAELIAEKFMAMRWLKNKAFYSLITPKAVAQFNR
jgi:uncharacterized protein (TIGR04255 family)